MNARLSLLALFLVACGGTTSGSDAGADGSRNPCDGLGCAIGVGVLRVHVLDAQSMAPIAGVSFSRGGAALAATCAADAGAPDGGAACATWELDALGFGANTIDVAAPGYKAASLSVTMSGPSGCCGRGPDVEKTVTLSPADAAMLCAATGGTVMIGRCCGATADFPDMCVDGPCGCAPQSSHDTAICACPTKQCFKPGVGCQ